MSNSEHPAGYTGDRTPNKAYKDLDIYVDIRGEEAKFFDIRSESLGKYERVAILLPPVVTDGWSDYYAGKEEMLVSIDEGTRAHEIIKNLSQKITASLEKQGLHAILRKFSCPCEKGKIRFKFQNNTRVYNKTGDIVKPKEVGEGEHVAMSALVGGYNFDSRAGLFFKLLRVKLV